jgi:hypothetical protein
MEDITPAIFLRCASKINAPSAVGTLAYAMDVCIFASRE